MEGYSSRLRLLAAVIFIFSLTAQGSDPNVLVTCEVDTTELYWGWDANVTVKALVENPSSGNDGIFTYDVDLILGNSSVLSIVPGTVNRPDVDPNLGGSDGNVQSWGINAVAGGYWQLDRGIGTPQTLFTAQISGEAIGSSTIAIGPDTEIMGIDFVLSESSSYAVDYSGADLTLDVVVLSGDANLDKKVGAADLAILAAHWGQSGEWTEGDFSSDGNVGAADLAMLAANWGSTFGGGGQAVPEPATMSLLAVSGLGLVLRGVRRKGR